MDLRQYLQIAWRRKVFILLGIAIGAALAFWLQSTARPSYSATAQLLLLPRDPNERVTDGPGGPFDMSRYVAAQVSILESGETAETAAATLGGDLSAGDVRGAVSAEADDASDIVFVTATSESPEQAAAIANAVSESYIENRRAAQVESLRNAADEIGTQLDALDDRIADLRDQAGDNAVVAADLEAANLQYTSLYGRQQDLLIDSTLKRGEAQVIEPASAPSTPDGRSLPVTLVLGGLLGGLVGLGIAYLRDQVDDRLRSSEEVEQLTGLPVLAEIPVDTKLSGRDVLAHEAAPMGAVAESFRALRTGVSFLGIDDPIARVLVTSAVPGEGKTFVAANFAASCAQAGFRTVLVSADLRRPRIEAYFPHDASLPGLTQVITARVPALDPSAPAPAMSALESILDTAVQPTAHKDLFLLPSGPCPPNPAEMLASPRMAEVLLLLQQSYDITVLDTSPVGPVADALALAPTVGNVLLVTSQRRSRRREVERMIRAVARTNARVLGVALNRAGSGRKAKGYGTDGGSTVYGDVPTAVPAPVLVVAPAAPSTGGPSEGVQQAAAPAAGPVLPTVMTEPLPTLPSEQAATPPQNGSARLTDPGATGGAPVAGHGAGGLDATGPGPAQPR